ncbi:MAG: hypothetical protein ACYC1C_10160 [Chloroflexota bacterium]
MLGLDPTFLGALGRLGLGFILFAIWALIRGRRRSLADDAQRALARLGRPLRVEGAEHVPAAAPFILVGNHFQAPGLWVGWVALAISDAVAGVREAGGRDLHWLATSEWRWFEVAGRWVPNPLTSLLFPRAYAVWGLVPTPANPADVPGRARALRQMIAYLGKPSAAAPRPSEPIALFPEGEATTGLQEARPGTGAFLERISSRGMALLPVGVYLEGETLVIRFGQPFALAAPADIDRDSRDDWARERVMVNIGRLLPCRLWGFYAEAIAK